MKAVPTLNSAFWIRETSEVESNSMAAWRVRKVLSVSVQVLFRLGA